MEYLNEKKIHLIQEVTYWIEKCGDTKEVEYLQGLTVEELETTLAEILNYETDIPTVSVATHKLNRRLFIQKAFEGAVREINEDFEEEVYSMLDENGQWNFTILQEVIIIIIFIT